MTIEPMTETSEAMGAIIFFLFVFILLWAWVSPLMEGPPKRKKKVKIYPFEQKIDKYLDSPKFKKEQDLLTQRVLAARGSAKVKVQQERLKENESVANDLYNTLDLLFSTTATGNIKVMGLLRKINSKIVQKNS